MKKKYLNPTIEVIELSVQKSLLLSLSNGEADTGSEENPANLSPEMQGSGSDDLDW